MRFLSFILILTLALPPVPLAACDHASPDAGVSGGHAHHAVDHGAVPDPATGPAIDHESSRHSCCEQGSGEAPCNAPRHCASGAQVSAVADVPDAVSAVPHVDQPLAAPGVRFPPSHSHPPYRPPAA
jgi:hypothetical protein